MCVRKVVLSRLVFVFIMFAVIPSDASEMKETLRKSLAASLAVPEAIQWVTLGPLSDKRIISLEIRYHSERGTGGPKIRRGKSPDQFQVDFPRLRIAKVPIIADATFACSKYPSLCFHMQEYLNRVDQEYDIENVPFIDELYPKYAADLERIRSGKYWAASILASVEAVVLAINLHELGHAVLEHDLSGAPISTATILRQEAEADGFLLGFMEITELSAVGGAVVLLQNVFREEVFGELTIKHPRPSCRAAAFTNQATQWVRANLPRLKESSLDAEIDRLSMSAIDSMPLLSKLLDILNRRVQGCDDYNKHVAIGVHKTAQLLDEDTPLKTSP